jgi:hypothetical protein
LNPHAFWAPPPQDGVSANFTTSARNKLLCFNYLSDALRLTVASSPDFAPSKCRLGSSSRAFFLSSSYHRVKEPLNHVCPRTQRTHRRFHTIVPGNLPQCTEAGVFPSSGQEGVPGYVQPASAKVNPLKRLNSPCLRRSVKQGPDCAPAACPRAPQPGRRSPRRCCRAPGWRAACSPLQSAAGSAARSDGRRAPRCLCD